MDDVAKVAAGIAFLLKFGDGANPPVYRTMGGFRMATTAITKGKTDFIAKGILLSNAARSQLQDAAISGDGMPMQFSYEDGSRDEGTGFINELRLIGQLNGEDNYQITGSLCHD